MSGSWTMALGMVLLLEGIIPFLFPKGWRSTFQRILELSDGQIRFLGLLSLCFGLILIGLARYFY